jgi:hypothetical protein
VCRIKHKRKYFGLHKNFLDKTQMAQPWGKIDKFNFIRIKFWSPKDNVKELKLTPSSGERKKGKEQSMVDVLSMHIWIWNIETCWSHFKEGCRRERLMEGCTKLEHNTYIYGNVTMKPPV